MSFAKNPEVKLEIAPEVQTSIATLGMWVFLATECLLFSVLLFSLGLYRHLYPHDFSVGTGHLSLRVGTLNTAILLTSSFTMVLAVHFAKISDTVKSKKFAYSTAVLGFVFLVLKFMEYHDHYEEGLVPGIHWLIGNQSQNLKLYFVLYFFSTSLHALHLLIGIFLVSLVPPKNKAFTENVGLYWHFVDVVWIFLFPLLYLLGRT
jgi:cytochrome c oxidase subunit 3